MRAGKTCSVCGLPAESMTSMVSDVLAGTCVVAIEVKSKASQKVPSPAKESSTTICVAVM